MDMEQIKDKALDMGKKLLSGVFGLVKKTAETTLKLTGKAAGKAAGFAREKAGVVLHKTGEKVRAKASEQDGALLLLGLVFASLALLAFVLRAYGKKK